MVVLPNHALLASLPSWALHEILTYAESSSSPAAATTRLCSVNRDMRRSMLSEIVLTDVRASAEIKFRFRYSAT